MRRWFHAWQDQDPYCPSCQVLDDEREAAGMYVYMCVYMCTCAYMHVCSFIPVCIHIYVCKCAHVHMCSFILVKEIRALAYTITSDYTSGELVVWQSSAVRRECGQGRSGWQDTTLRGCQPGLGRMCETSASAFRCGCQHSQ